MPGPAWSAQEKKSLERQVKREKRVLADVEIPGRTVNAIRAQAFRQGLVQKRATRKQWSQEQRDRLKELQQQGFMPQEISFHHLLGPPLRTKWSIAKQWGRLQLADKCRSDRMRRKRRWAPGEKDEFSTYLLRYSKSKTPEEIAKQWGISRGTVSRWQHALGVKMSREQVMQMPYSQEKQKRAWQRIQQATKKRWKQRIRQREESLLELAIALRSRARPPIERTCSSCGHSWPKRREFFPHYDKKSSFGTSRYYKHRCILCENARRRMWNKAARRESVK